MWGYATLVVLGLVLCTAFGWSYGRWQAQQRGIDLSCATYPLDPSGIDSQDWRTVIGVTNRGRVTEEHVVIWIETQLSEDAWCIAEVERATSKGPRLIVRAAEHDEPSIVHSRVTFAYLVDWMEAGDAIVIHVNASEKPLQIRVLASASIANRIYEDPPPDG